MPAVRGRGRHDARAAVRARLPPRVRGAVAQEAQHVPGVPPRAPIGRPGMGRPAGGPACREGPRKRPRAAAQRHVRLRPIRRGAAWGSRLDGGCSARARCGCMGQRGPWCARPFAARLQPTCAAHHSDANGALEGEPSAAHRQCDTRGGGRCNGERHKGQRAKLRRRGFEDTINSGFADLPLRVHVRVAGAGARPWAVLFCSPDVAIEMVSTTLTIQTMMISLGHDYS
mmetsp:Transcript_15463/g.40005  ORF Transcript_15463/g.40005 Transcript_15463/m.40005 type:complete len:228 (-) Transcript_15463:51-734(-)